MVQYIHNITKEYPDMIVVKIYRQPFKPDLSLLEEMRQAKSKHKLVRRGVSERSLRRSKQIIKDIVLCNDFDLFCTFTFDRRKHDRYNKLHCKVVLENWLRNQRTHSPDLRYLVVPELHKDGAIHFHALLSHFNGRLSLSKHKVNDRPVFNLSGYRAGFSTAVKIDNREAVAHYITKYITKELVVEYQKKRYFCSKNLKRPVKKYNTKITDFKNSLFMKSSYNNGLTEVQTYYNFPIDSQNG